MIEKLGITPGPWRRIDSRQIVKSDGGVIVTAWWFGNKGSVDLKEAEANARLSAAAPEMLEALIDLYDDWKHIEWVDPAVAIKPIIEKATGMTWAEVKQLLEVEE